MNNALEGSSQSLRKEINSPRLEFVLVDVRVVLWLVVAETEAKPAAAFRQVDSYRCLLSIFLDRDESFTGIA